MIDRLKNRRQPIKQTARKQLIESMLGDVQRELSAIEWRVSALEKVARIDHETGAQGPARGGAEPAQITEQIGPSRSRVLPESYLRGATPLFDQHFCMHSGERVALEASRYE